MRSKKTLTSEAAARRDSRKALQTLLNPFTHQFLHDEKLLQLFAQFVDDQNNRTFDLDFKKLYDTPSLRKAMRVNPHSLEDMSTTPYFKISLSQAIAYTKIIFSFHEEELSKFYENRILFERALLNGSYATAESTLAEIENLTGATLWSIRSRLVLFSLSGRAEEMGRFCEASKAQAGDAFLSTVMTWMLLVTTDPTQHVRTIKSNIRELQQAGIHELADLISLIFIPMPHVEKWRRLTCIREIQSLHIIDRFVLCESLLRNNSYAPEEPEHQLFRIVLDIRQSSINKAGLKSDEPLIKALIKCYEVDDFDGLISEYAQFSDKLTTPLAVSPLVAKAYAQSMIQPPHSSPIEEVISALASIYKMKGPIAQAVDSLRSKSLQLAFISDSELLQNAIYTATPLAFPIEARQRLATRSILGSRTSTPWTQAVAAGTEPVLEYTYDVDYEDLPLHRRKKTEIRELINSDSIDTAAVLKILDEFKPSAPLPRDYFELASASLRAIGAEAELLSICSLALAQRSSAVTAFPMHHIANFIEASRNCTIDAVIVSYFYATFVEPEKTYLLNETYEEYLLDNGVRKPSELPLNLSDPKDLILVRDISTLATMDFLGSFDTTNDLRAERIRLLDLLRDSDHMSSDDHRTEVDEILGQVVIDSGATEFSASKININLKAMSRKLTDEIDPLFVQYKSLKEVPSDTLLKQPQDPKRLAALSVVAGDKNTTLLRMITLVRNVFLHDDSLGLDRNLSAEIRHGFFSNLMRSHLENHHLLSEIDDDGKYNRNDYWYSQNALLAFNLREKVDKELSWFSATFNKLIEDGEQWMKITEDIEDTDRVFSFPMYVALFEQLKRVADRVDSAGQFVELLLQHLSSSLDSALMRMREKINVDLKDKIDALFEELLLRFDAQPAALVDLVSAVQHTRNDIREDIATAASWFERTTDFEPASRTIPYLIDIAAECYGRVRASHFKIEKEVHTGLSSITIDGTHVKAFLLALINLFENSVRHSGFGPSTPINVSGELTHDGWKLVVANPITEDKYKKIMCGPFASGEIDTDIGAVKVEGGSGLGKVVNQLNSISNAITVSVDPQPSNFFVRIQYATPTSC